MSAAWLSWLALAATMPQGLTVARMLRRRDRSHSRPAYLQQR